MVCGPAAAVFHSLLYRRNPSEVLSVPNGALLHHAKLVLGDGAADDELTPGAGVAVAVTGAGVGVVITGVGAEVLADAVGTEVLCTGVDVPCAGMGAEVPFDGDGVELPRDVVAMAVPTAIPGPPVATLRHPTASRATTTSGTTFRTFITDHGSAGWDQRSRSYNNVLTVHTSVRTRTNRSSGC